MIIKTIKELKEAKKVNVLVIGANGNVGRRVIQQLQETDHTSVALVRKEEQVSTLKELGADKVVLGNLEEDFSHAFENIDTVIFTAGSGGSTGYDKTLTIDLYGVVKAVNYAEEANVKNHLQVSSTNSPNPEAGFDHMKAYAVAKSMADFYIRQSSLNHTIIQPGPLSDDKGLGKINVSDEVNKHPSEYTIARDDLATVLITAIENDKMENKTFVIESGNIEIEDAFN